MRASVRYLGVHLDTGLRIKTHVRKIKARSIEKFNALAAIAKRDWGLDHACISTLYNGIFIPIAIANRAEADSSTSSWSPLDGD